MHSTCPFSALVFLIEPHLRYSLPSKVSDDLDATTELRQRIQYGSFVRMESCNFQPDTQLEYRTAWTPGAHGRARAEERRLRVERFAHDILAPKLHEKKNRQKWGKDSELPYDEREYF